MTCPSTFALVELVEAISTVAAAEALESEQLSTANTLTSTTFPFKIPLL